MEGTREKRTWVGTRGEWGMERRKVETKNFNEVTRGWRVTVCVAGSAG